MIRGGVGGWQKGGRKEVGEGTIIKVELEMLNCFNREGSSHEIFLE